MSSSKWYERLIGKDPDYEGNENEYDQTDYAEDIPVQPQEVRRPTGAISSPSASSLEMKIVRPEKFEEVTAIADHLLSRRTVVLNLENTSKETVRRIIDFLSGIAYAIEGQIKKVANSTYVITPKNVDVSSGVDNQADDSQKELF